MHSERDTIDTHMALKKKTTQKIVPHPQAHEERSAVQPRRLRLPRYKFFRIKPIMYPERLPTTWALVRQVGGVLWLNRYLFLGIVAVYAVLNILLVHGFSSAVDVGATKQQLLANTGGATAGQIAADLSAFGTLLTTASTNVSAASGAYQLMLGVLISLAVIWTLRQLSAGQHITLRDVFYKSMYPLVPFLLVLLVLFVQCIPFLVGGLLYTFVVAGGLAVSAVEQIVFGIISIILIFISVYMLCSSIFALYIITLPDMTPRKALRAAGKLVRYRRGAVFWRLLVSVVLLFFALTAVMLPFITWVAVLAPWIFYVLTLAVLPVVHTYLYTLYKALLA
jgi:hypothetical protein